MYCIWQIILIVCSTILTIPVRTGVFYSAATDITVSKYGHITLPVLKLSALLFPVPITSRLRLTFVQMCSVGQLKHWRTVFGNGEIIPSHFIKMFRTMFWFLICMEAVAYSQISYSEMGPWSVFSFFGSLLKSTYVEVIMSHYALSVIPLSKVCKVLSTALTFHLFWCHSFKLLHLLFLGKRPPTKCWCVRSVWHY